MASTVIVALPALDEKVYQLSSEKIPHLTMLYLGDDEGDLDSADVVTFVQHAAKHLSPFYLSVDYRGTLGDKQADVLFFEDNFWELPEIERFRNQLLLNKSIRRAYDSAEQFGEWTPHLTMGYPTSPAKKDTDENLGIHMVRFDRLAVWFGDYEGPEIRLKHDNHAMEVSMSDMTATITRGAQVVEDLFHSGVKGMKWGVRKAEGAQKQADAQQKYATKLASKTDGTGLKGARARSSQRQADALQKNADKKWDKVDQKWQKSIYTTSGAVAVHNAMADYCNARVGALNDKYPDANLWEKPYSETTQKYHDEVDALQSKAYDHAVTSAHGASPSGKKHAVFVEDEQGIRIEVRSTDVKHAEEAEPDLVVLLKVDESGHILEANQAELEVAHSGDSDAFLAHFGVKGMKWGVRNDSKGGGGSAAPKERGKIRRGATKASIALDAGHEVIKKGEEKLIFLPVAKRDKAAGATQSRMLGEAAALNRDPRFKGKDLKRDPKLADEYHKELTHKAVDIYKEELGQVRAEALAEFVSYAYDKRQEQLSARVSSDRIKHDAESDELLFVLDYKTDDLGHVVDMALNTDDLKHYGVKGMKWGVTTVDKASSPTLTREKKALRNTKDVTVTQRKAGTYVKTKGGKRQKATDDAVKAAAARQKAKKSTTDALTNDELKAAVERMNLEQQYHKLDAKTKRRGQGFVSMLFQNSDARSAAADLAKRVNETNS